MTRALQVSVLILLGVAGVAGLTVHQVDDEGCEDGEAPRLARTRDDDAQDMQAQRVHDDALKVAMEEQESMEKERSWVAAEGEFKQASKELYFIRHFDEGCTQVDARVSHRGRHRIDKMKADHASAQILAGIEVVLTSPSAACMETAFGLFPNVPAKMSTSLFEVRGTINRKTGLQTILEFERNSDMLDDYENLFGTVGSAGANETIEDKYLAGELVVSRKVPGHRWQALLAELDKRSEKKIAIVTHKHLMEIGLGVKLEKGEIVRFDFDGARVRQYAFRKNSY